VVFLFRVWLHWALGDDGEVLAWGWILQSEGG